MLRDNRAPGEKGSYEKPGNYLGAAAVGSFGGNDHIGTPPFN